MNIQLLEPGKRIVQRKVGRHNDSRIVLANPGILERVKRRDPKHEDVVTLFGGLGTNEAAGVGRRLGLEPSYVITHMYNFQSTKIMEQNEISER